MLGEKENMDIFSQGNQFCALQMQRYLLKIDFPVHLLCSLDFAEETHYDNCNQNKRTNREHLSLLADIGYHIDFHDARTYWLTCAMRNKKEGFVPQ